MPADAIDRAVLPLVPAKRAAQPVEMAYGGHPLPSDESSYTTGAGQRNTRGTNRPGAGETQWVEGRRRDRYSEQIGSTAGGETNRQLLWGQIPVLRDLVNCREGGSRRGSCVPRSGQPVARVRPRGDTGRASEVWRTSYDGLRPRWRSGTGSSSDLQGWSVRRLEPSLAVVCLGFVPRTRCADVLRRTGFRGPAYSSTSPTDPRSNESGKSRCRRKRNWHRPGPFSREP